MRLTRTGRTRMMAHAKPTSAARISSNRGPLGGAKPADPADRAAEQAQRGDGGETAAEHDWLATLDLVRRVSQHVRHTDETAKNLARNAHAFIHYANRMFEDGPAEVIGRRSVAVLAGLVGIGLSWLALLWFIFSEEPFFGLYAATPGVARHHVVTLAQCALFTSLALVIVGVLHRGFRASTGFYEAVLKRSAQHEPGSSIRHDRKQVVREGHLDGRPYVLFSNGAVDLETVFGVRSFGSLDEAREFMGEAKPALKLAQ